MSRAAQLVFMDPRDDPDEVHLMPKDFAPDLAVQNDPEKGIVVVCSAQADAPDGKKVNVRLGFRTVDDAARNGQMMVQLWQSVWQAMEMIRVGRPA